MFKSSNSKLISFNSSKDGWEKKKTAVRHEKQMFDFPGLRIALAPPQSSMSDGNNRRFWLWMFERMNHVFRKRIKAAQMHIF